MSSETMAIILRNSGNMQFLTDSSLEERIEEPGASVSQ